MVNLLIIWVRFEKACLSGFVIKKLNQAFLATETRKHIKFLHAINFGFRSNFSGERKNNMLFRLQRCAGWSVPLLFLCNKIGFFTNISI